MPLLSRSDDARVINHSSMLGSMGTAESMWAHVGGFMAVGYSTSKAGLNMLSLIQSKTLASKAVAVAAAHPGWVKTDLGSQAAPMEVEEGATRPWGSPPSLVTSSRTASCGTWASACPGRTPHESARLGVTEHPLGYRPRPTLARSIRGGRAGPSRP